MKIANKRCPRGNILLYISSFAISFVLILMISTMRADNKSNIFVFDTSGLITTEGVEPSFFEKFLSADNIMNAMYIMIIISFVLTTIVVTSIWINERRQLIYALRLCGIDNKFQFFEITKRYIGIFVAGFLSATAASFVLTIIETAINIKLKDVVWAYVMTMCTGLVIIIANYSGSIIKSSHIK